MRAAFFCRKKKQESYSDVLEVSSLIDYRIQVINWVLDADKSSKVKLHLDSNIVPLKISQTCLTCFVEFER